MDEKRVVEFLSSKSDFVSDLEACSADVFIVIGTWECGCSSYIVLGPDRLQDYREAWWEPCPHHATELGLRVEEVEEFGDSIQLDGVPPFRPEDASWDFFPCII